MKHRFFLAAFLVAAFVTSSNAQFQENWNIFRSDTYSLAKKLEEGVTADLQHRKDRQQLLKTKQILTGDTELFWTDGRFILSTFYEEEENEISVRIKRQMEPTPSMENPQNLKVVGKKVKVVDKTPLFVTVEKLGQYTILVYRTAQGTPVKAYYSIDNESTYDGMWTIFMHYLLDGSYRLENGETAVFGHRQDFYEGKSYNTDPGIYQFYIHPEDNIIDIIYGEGRVSRGDPSSPKFGNMPGGGGAGALMGPMVWQVKFTTQGLDAKVTLDEKFVDHSPALNSNGNNVLTKLQCPWEGIDGKWAFASVIPLTHELLKLFPKKTLELIRAEIYARHGDKFTNADNQRYFDAQPWYHKSSNPVVLTDIERFNVALIKHIISTKK